MSTLMGIAATARAAIRPGSAVRLHSVITAPGLDGYRLRFKSITHDRWAMTEIEQWDDDTVAHVTKQCVASIERAIERGEAKKL